MNELVKRLENIVYKLPMKYRLISKPIIINFAVGNLKETSKFLELTKEEDFNIIHAHSSSAGLVSLTRETYGGV